MIGGARHAVGAARQFRRQPERGRQVRDAVVAGVERHEKVAVDQRGQHRSPDQHVRFADVDHREARRVHLGDRAGEIFRRRDEQAPVDRAEKTDARLSDRRVGGRVARR